MLRHARFDRDSFRFQLDVRRVRDALRDDRLTAARGRDKSSDEEVQDTSPHRVGGSVTYLLRCREFAARGFAVEIGIRGPGSDIRVVANERASEPTRAEWAIGTPRARV